MSACNIDLTSVDMLTPLGFRLTINAQEFRNLEYFCTSVSLPGVTLPNVETNFRNFYAQISGDSLAYDNLSVTFIVDEKLKNYLEVFTWMHKNSHEEIEYKDMTLSILTNQNNTNKQIRFNSAIPIALSNLEFNTQTTDVEYLTCTVDFAYTQFDFLR